MKTKIRAASILLGLALLSVIMSAYGVPAYEEIDQNEALEIAMRQFEGRNYDYYLVEQQNSAAGYIFFVDAMPGMDWEHECYVVFVDSRINWPVSSYIPQVVSCSAPPDCPLISVKMADRKPVGLTEVPYVPKSLPSDMDLAVAERTWAVIISGGVNANQNYERYWNNCAYIYRTLTNGYHISKNNISVIMADGSNPGKDQIVEKKNEHGSVIGTYYRSSPLDLDGNGEADIQYAATRANIINVLTDLQSKANSGDHVFLFVTDHGGSIDKDNGVSYICLWGNDRLYDYELAEWIDPLLKKGITISCILGQCYSGGFVDDLAKNGCVVAAAAPKDQTSYGNEEVSHFLYDWTYAHNDHWNQVDSNYPRDTINLDDDYYITMDEAFLYAYKKEFGEDRQLKSQLYRSTHPFLGAQLAFDNLPADIDLIIQDNKEDMGHEPNTTTSIFYDSPSIWVRNEDDDQFEHQNPYFSVDHDGCWVYVRVHNRGRMDYPGGQYLHVYWAQAALTVSSRTWLGEETYNDYTTGGLIGYVPINSIKAGESRIVKMRWEMPPLPTDVADRHHFCLLAKVMTNEFDDGGMSSNSYFNPEVSRRQAQKNLSIIHRFELADVHSVFVRNPDENDDPRGGSDEFSLELIPRTKLDGGIFQVAKAEVELNTPVYNAWVKGGRKMCNVTLNPIMPRKMYFNSENSRIESLRFDGKEFDKVKIKFIFTTNDTTLLPRKYRIDLIQRDYRGHILGGEAFIVEPPLMLTESPDINISSNRGNEVTMSVDSSESFDVNWWNEAGDILCNDDSIVVRPTVGACTYKVSALNKTGGLAFNEVSLRSVVGIESISPESAVGNTLIVTMRSPTAYGDKLIIAGVDENGDRRDIAVEDDSESISVDTSSLRPGLYVLSYVSSNVVVDSKKFTKK